MKKLKTEELNRLTLEEFKKAQKNPIVLVLDNIRSLNNIGSIFRTADAFRISHMYLCGITATPPHREIQKTALGSTESVEWSYFPSTKEAVDMLHQKGFNILALEQTDGSIFLNTYQPAPNSLIALVLGNEVKGVSDEIIEKADACIEIPQFGYKHSFNVTVSNGIALWDLTQKLGLMNLNET